MIFDIIICVFFVYFHSVDNILEKFVHKFVFFSHEKVRYGYRSIVYQKHTFILTDIEWNNIVAKQ